jgi:hypothetical protein
MRRNTREALEASLQLADLSVRDPASAAANASRIAALLATAAGAWRGEPNANRIVVPTSSPKVTRSTAEAQPTASVEVRFPGAGRIVGIMATVAEGNEHRSKVSVQISINDEVQLVTTGTGAGWLPLSLLSGFDRDSTHFFAFERELRANDRVYVRFITEANVLSNGATAEVYTPKIAFMYDQTNESVNY